MFLKRGITGFFNVNEYPVYKIYNADFKRFRQMCYLFSVDNYNLNCVYNPKSTSYFYADFVSDKGSIYVLMNKYHPVVSFTDNLVMGEKIFIDIINISENPSYFPDCDVISAKILNSPFADTENNLSKAELQQIEYWKPTSVGNIIFNEWD